MSNHQLIHAFKWSAASEIASKAIQPLVFILLARLLTPEDFGVMTSALMVIGFSQIFWEAGMNKALIQRQTNVDEAANVAFWINVALGCFIAVLLYFIANLIAYTFFQDGRVTAVLQVMTLHVILGAFAAVHTALLQKKMDFKRLFWVRFATVGLPGLASIPLAWNGMGYWALVVGVLVGQAAQVIMLWNLSKWRPSWEFHTAVAKEMSRFGAWVGVAGLLAWFYMWADSLIVGMYLGVHELGLYRIGNQFAIMIFAIIFGPIMPVLYSHLVKMNSDMKRVGRTMEHLIKALIIIAIPISFVLFSLSEPIGEVLFGEQWTGVGLVIGVMALTHGYSWVIGMNGEAYRAVGKPHIETIVMASTLLIYLVAYLVGIQYGFEAFVWVRLSLAIGALVAHFAVLNRVLSLPVASLIRFLLIISVFSIVITQLVGLFLTSYISSDLKSVIIGGVINFIFISSVIYVLEKNGLILAFKLFLAERKA